METERDIFKYIRDGNLQLPPMTFALVESESRVQEFVVDLLLLGKYGDRSYKFATDIKRYSSDKAVAEAANAVRYASSTLDASPMIVVPWLSDAQLRKLDESCVSGVDLCGNGVVVLPGELLIFRSGQPNKFPLSRTVKRVYQGATSLVPRMFLLQKEFCSVSQILEEIIARGGGITLPTVSKALAQLEEDLVIEKTRDNIRLLQPDKLLQRLRDDYQQPKISSSIRCKLSLNESETAKTLRKLSKEPGANFVLSGVTSSDRYAVFAREPLDIIYCSKNPIPALQAMGVSVDLQSRFPNVEFRETDSKLVYFDTRVSKDKIPYSSPIQAYLELATSDKRGQETSEQIRKLILEDLAKN